jgi:hypothetical protein
MDAATKNYVSSSTATLHATTPTINVLAAGVSSMRLRFPWRTVQSVCGGVCHDSFQLRTDMQHRGVGMSTDIIVSGVGSEL